MRSFPLVVQPGAHPGARAYRQRSSGWCPFSLKGAR